MKLYLESGKVIDDPSDEEIEAFLPPHEEFAILSDGPESFTYLQVAERSDPPGFVLEYQIVSLEHHFFAVDSPLTRERIVAAFQKYARGDRSWKADFEWELMELP